MNWAWMASLDQLWRSPTFPMWLTLAAAGFFAIIVLVTLIRAEKSVANGALTVITLLAIGIAVAATIRSFGFGGDDRDNAVRQVAEAAAAPLPALSCLDDLAGDTVLAACEKTLFGSAETTAAAVSYAAARISRLTSFGDVAAANRTMTPDTMALRRAIERDRYGLVAQVLRARDGCQPGDCAAYASLTDHNLIAANMDEKLYDVTVARYAPGWNAPAASPTAWNAPGATTTASISGLPASVPTGKPTNAEFPTSASIPPINIMTPEPTTAAPRASVPPPVTASAQPRAPVNAATTAAPKKPAAPKNRPPTQAQTAPVQLAPAPASANN